MSIPIPRLCGTNWLTAVARTRLQPKYLMAITETYSKAPGDDVYANGPVTYLRLDQLPEPGNYAPKIETRWSEKESRKIS